MYESNDYLRTEILVVLAEIYQRFDLMRVLGREI